MSKGKRVKKKQPFVDIYGVLLLVATLVMSIGYAEIVGTTITVETKAEASSQEGVFITDVICNESNSVSNNYLATTLDSSITLDSPTDTKSFTVTIYNKTVKPYVFVGVKKLDKWDEFTGVYNNTNISYTFGNDMVPHETIIQPKDWIVFNVDLGFNGQGQMPETLRSLINFSFQEIPTLEVVSEDTIENMYPNCKEKVYEFTVKNQRQDAEHGTITNGVPLTYTISPNVPAPLTAKIYDEDGTEVAGNKAITISSENSEEHTYTMKVKWDNTNPVQGKEYNNAEYAGQTLASSINIIATPDIIDDNDKYIGYTLDKNESVEIKTAPLYFDVTTDKTTVEMNNTTNAEKIMLTIKNNDGAEKINSFPVDYKLSIDNSKFTLLVDGSEIGEEPQTLGNTAAIAQPHEIQLISKDGQELEATENCNLTIEAITPYAKTETIELTIKDSTGPTAPVIQGGNTDTTYALSQTISVSEVSTDVGTGINKYQYLLNSDGTKTAEATADVTTTATSQTFTQDAPGYYVYFRAVDKAGNVGEWSNGQQIYIDTQKPTVTPKQDSVTITEGENYNLADYFTVVPNGTNTNYTVECTINGTKYTTTESIPVGTHTVICTATKVGGNSSSTTMELVVEAGWKVGVTLTAADIANAPQKYYGIEVEGYEPPNGDTVGWKIFYADSEYIYLVASDYIHYDYAPKGKDGSTTLYKASDYRVSFINLVNVYDGAEDILNSTITDSRVLNYLTWVNTYSTSINKNIKSVAYMVDTVRWNEKYKNNTYADYAIGGPTVEMFIKSYNQTYPDKGLTYAINDADGYYIGSGNLAATGTAISGLDKQNSLYVITNSDKAFYWWLASPSAYSQQDLFAVSSLGGIDSYFSASALQGFRPLVCLKSGVDLETIAGGKVKVLLPRVQITNNQEMLEISKGDSNSFDSLFTVTTRDGGTATKTYTLNGVETSYKNTSELPVGIHTITCIATYNGQTVRAKETVLVKSNAPRITTATSIQSETKKYVDDTGINEIVVPGGFKVKTDLATTVDKGIVIEDSTGNNQFVWVPIGDIIKSDDTTVTIEFGRYSDFSTTAKPVQYASNYESTVTVGSLYQELSSYRESQYAMGVENCNATAKNLEAFIKNTQENGGYYIARYEASFGSGDTISSVTSGTTSAGTKAITNQKPAFKQSTRASSNDHYITVTSTPGMLWNYIRQGDASMACQNLYTGNEYNGKSYVESDLVNSYAWDTAIMFIQKCSDKSDYANQGDGNGTLHNTGETTDNPCNIYDMAGNLLEMTTEYSIYNDGTNCLSVGYRGGSYDNTNNFAASRGATWSTSTNPNLGFRSVLTVPYAVQVNANEDTLEITEGTENTFDSLFTVTTKDSGTATRTYKLNGTTTNIRNTSDLAEGTHTITCTATYNGVSDTASVTVVVNSAKPDFSSVYIYYDYDGSGSCMLGGVPEGYTPVVLSCISQWGEDTIKYAWIDRPREGDYYCGWDLVDTGGTYNVHIGFMDSNGILLDVDLYFENVLQYDWG